MTIFDAVDKQLGIKLKKQKHPIQVMAIDHVDHPVESEN
jgi:uncharacterized protein (TIGR03435 family)